MVMRNTKVTKVTKDKVKHFDFEKKPINPRILFPVARHVVSKPLLKMRGYTLKKTKLIFRD